MADGLADLTTDTPSADNQLAKVPAPRLRPKATADTPTKDDPLADLTTDTPPVQAVVPASPPQTPAVRSSPKDKPLPAQVVPPGVGGLAGVPIRPIAGAQLPSPTLADKYLATPQQPVGMVSKGNVDLTTRPQVRNFEGTFTPHPDISTVRSMSFEENGKEILVPTISDDGKILTDQQAIDLYHQTGKNLGVFKDAKSADAYAQSLHEQQAAMLTGARGADYKNNDPLGDLTTDEPPKDDRPQYVKGFIAGLAGANAKMTGDALDGFGVLTGNQSLRDLGKTVGQYGSDVTNSNAPDVGSFSEIRTDNPVNFVTDVGKYIQYGLPNAVGTSAPSIVTGALASLATDNPIVGLAAGAAAPSYIQNYGDVYGSARDDPTIAAKVASGQLNIHTVAAVSAVAAVPIALLDVFSLGEITHKVLFGEFKKALVARIVRGIATGALVEGSTEGLQEVFSQTAQQYLGSDTSFETKAISVIDNALIGAMGGVAFGGGEGLASGGKGPPRANTQPPAPTVAPGIGTLAGASINQNAGPAVPAPEPTATVPFDYSIFGKKAGSTQILIQDAIDAGIGKTPQEVFADAGYVASIRKLMPDQQAAIDKAVALSTTPAAAAPAAAEAETPRTVEEVDKLTQQYRDSFTDPRIDAATVDSQVKVYHDQLMQDFGLNGTTQAPKPNLRPGAPAAAATPTLAEVPATPAAAGVEAPAAAAPAVPDHLADLSTNAPGTRDAPVTVETPEQLATASAVVNTAPTPAQAAAGNYQLGHIDVQGLDISIENPAGSTRSGTAPDGTAWQVAMPAAYGYVKGTKGQDGEQVDVYVGPNPKSDNVFVVDQVDAATGAPDEQKAMLGFDSEEAAITAYKAGFSDGKGAQRIGGVTTMSIDQFKASIGKPSKARAAVKTVGKPKTPAKNALLERLIAQDMTPQERRAAIGAGAKLPFSTLTIQEHAIAENDYDRLARLSSVLDMMGTEDSRPTGASKGGKKGAAERDAAVAAWEPRHKAREAVAALIHAKQSDQIEAAMKEAGLSNGDTVAYTEGVIDGRTGEASATPVKGPLHHTKGQSSASVHSGGGILFLSPTDIRKRLKKEASSSGTKSKEKAAKEKTTPKKEPVSSSPAKPQKSAPDKSANLRIKEPSKWEEVGKNAAGVTLYEDQRGVRSYIQDGPVPGQKFGQLRVSEPVGIIPGGGIVTPSHKGEWATVSETGTAEKPVEHPGLVIKSLQTGKEETIQPPGTVAPKPKAAPATTETTEAPTWAQVVDVMPKDKTGVADVERAFAIMSEITGENRPAFKSLTDAQKVQVFDRVKAMVAAQPVVTPTAPVQSAEYGAGNKLVTKDRAEELRARLRNKLKNQVSAGIDPEMLSLGAELAAFHIEAGARKFTAFAKAIANDLGVKIDAIRPYLRAWYNAARDLMEDGGVDVAGMDTPDQVREALKALGEANEPAVVEGPGPAALEGKPAAAVQGTKGGRKAGGRTGLRGGANAPGNVEPGRGRPDNGTGVGEDQGGVPVSTGKPVDSAATPAGNVTDNYVLSDADNLGDGGSKTKLRQNLAAIKLIKDLNGGKASPTQQAVLAKYVGWGGLKQAFPHEDGKFTAGWEDAGKELKEALTPSEYAAARASTQNAHYTSPSVVKATWSALDRLGFKGGRILEPSVGTGNFLGFMPGEVRGQTQINAVELDAITGQIAKALYPTANIVSPMGFQDFRAPDGWFDLAIGNPPFGAVRLYDSQHKKISRFTIHNFFFAKSVDMLRDDGVLAMVVTNFVMDASRDSARTYIASKTELLGAIRLPNDAFAKNAGTEVTTDIIFLRKLKAGEKPTGEKWLDSKVVKDKEGRELLLNEYYVRHPEMMLGEFGNYGTMYARESAALIARPSQDTPALLAKAIARLPQNVMPAPGALVRADKPEVPHTAAEAVVGSMFKSDNGVVWQRHEDLAGKTQAEPVNFESDKARERVSAMVDIRDAFSRLRAAQMEDATTDAQLASLRKTLNTTYDSFVAKQGPINADANKRLFRDDPTWPQISALEESYEKGISAAVAKTTGEKPREQSAVKAAVFTKRTQMPYHAPTSASSAKDALAATLVETGHVDMAMMVRLYGKPADEIVRELGDLIFKNPAGGYETRDHYLSGNVKQKYALAERAAAKDGQYERNVAALKAAIPADIAAVDINVKPGSHWIPPKHIAAFAQHITGRDNIKALYVPATAGWVIEGGRGRNDASDVKYGTGRVSSWEVLTAAVNGRQITVHDKDADGTSHINHAETDAANAKVQAVKDEWKSWLWADDARRTEVHRLYNDSFNTDQKREYDGSHLTFAGKVSDDVVLLRPHQANMVWRIAQSGTALLDHVVGSGKTYTMIAAAMELRRMGLAKKPMFAVPNHLVGQWAAAFIRLYPGAKILAATKKDFEAENRKRLFARVATGDYDAVIVAHSSFGKVPVDPKFQADFIEHQLADLEASIAAVQRATGQKKSRTVAQIEKQRDNLRAKLQRLMDSGSKDDSLTFEEMGVDALFVDEAHEFKNLGYSTSMQRVAGLGNQTGSQKASDLYVKVQSVLARTNGRNVVFATGTPISNTMAEMFTMQRYLDSKAMTDMGLSHFDAWARMFGEVVTDWELSPSGKYKLNSRFAKFVNMPELMQRYLSFADVITNDEIKKQLAAQGRTLPLPKVKGGKPTISVVDRSDAQAAYIGVGIPNANGGPDSYAKNTLIYRSENLPKGPPQKGDDNMLKIMSDARKAALDMRLIFPGSPDVPGSKVHVAADNIVRIYKKWDAQKGTQLAFIDLSTPKAAKSKEADRIRALMVQAEAGDEAAQEKLDDMSPDEFLALDSEFSVYDDLRQKLIARGIPANEIAFIHSANTELQKEELFGKVRSGRIRVLLGSTAKMGAGMNVQNLLVGLHHLDAPWRPSDLEQREGRIIRQGNELYALDPDGFEVEIMRYATKNTLDARMWQTIEGKARFIEQYRKGDIKSREIEDVAGEAANSAEMKAAASGNPLILEEMSLRQELRKLDTAKDNHLREQHRIRDSIQWNEGLAKTYAERMDAAKKDAALAETVPAKFAATISGTEFDKPSEAGQAILLEYGKLLDSGAETSALGSYGPFRLQLVHSAMGDQVRIRGAENHGVTIAKDSDATGLAMRIRNAIGDLAGVPHFYDAKIAEAKKAVTGLQAQIKPWGDGEKLAQVKARHDAVIAELRPKPKPPAPPEAKKGTTVGSTASRAAAPFYSAVVRAVEASKTAKASPDQWLATIKNTPGVKAEELEWMGLADWLKGQTGSVTKEAVADFVRANQIEVKGTDLGGEGGNLFSVDDLKRSYPHEFATLANEGVDVALSPDGAEVEFYFAADRTEALTAGELTQATGDDGKPVLSEAASVAADVLENRFRRGSTPDRTRFGTYQLPGGEDYHELLLSLPNRNGDATGGKKEFDAFLQQMAAKYQIHTAGRTLYDALSADDRAEFDRLSDKSLLEQGYQARSDKNYSSSHFDTPNIVAHVRFNTRTDAEGKRTLFVEEIQSDWHQAGRKRGYASEDALPDGFTIAKGDGDTWTITAPRGSRTTVAAPSEAAAIALARRTHILPAGVPDAPFKTSWPELALKRMVRWAAEKGYDQIAWTPGIEQVKRYEAPLRQQVKAVTWRPYGPSGLKYVEVVPHPGGHELGLELDANGVVVATSSHTTEAKGQPIEDIVGKEIARRIMSEERGRVEGDNLVIGGKGMEDFYDKMLVNAANKLGKKFGATVGKADIHAAQEPTVENLRRAREQGREDVTIEHDGDNMRVVGNDTGRVFYEGANYEAATKAAEQARLPVTTVHALPITPAMRESVMQGQALFQKTPQAQPRLKIDQAKRATLERALKAIIARVAGKDVVVRLEATINAEGAGDAAYNAGMKQYEAAGGKLGTNAGGVASMYLDGSALIRIAMDDPAFDPTDSAWHESYHRVEAQLMTDAEYAAVTTIHAEEQARAMAAKVLGRDPLSPEIAELPSYEARAIAFEGFVRGQEMPGISPVLRRFFERLARLLREVKALLTRQGYPTLNDVFEDVRTGKMADRTSSHRDITAQGSVAARAQTSTPAFKAWFGKSKVVDSEGKPLVVYHGTNDDFDQFSKGALGKATGARSAKMGFFFTDNSELGSSYADNENPYEDGIVGKLNRAVGGRYQPFNEAILRLLGRKSVLPSGQNVMALYLRIENPLEVDFDGEGPSSDKPFSAVIERAKAQGRDGVIIRGAIDPGFTDYPGHKGGAHQPSDLFIAFEPTQIKSALGNSGAFDATNPSIVGSTIPRTPTSVAVTKQEKAAQKAFVTQNEDDLHRIQTRTEAAVADMRERVVALPADYTKALDEKLYTYGEDKGGVKLTPEQKAVWDKHIAPLKAMEHRKWVEARALAAEAGMTPDETSEIGLSSADYMHRIAVGHAPAFDEGGNPMVGGRSLPRTTSSMRAAVFVTIENAKGERVVVSKGQSAINRWDNGQPSPLAGTDASTPLAMGDTLIVDGAEWNVVRGRSTEIEANTNVRYHKSAVATVADNYVRLSRVVEVLTYVNALKATPEWARYAVTDRLPRPPGWKRVEAPGFRNFWIHPKLANAVNDFVEGGARVFNGDVADKFEAVSRFAVGTLFWNPLPHIENVGFHWIVSRGFDWLKPSGYHSLAVDGLAAIKAAVTQNETYRDYLASGAALIAARTRNRDFMDFMLQRVGHEIERTRNRWQSVADILGYAKVEDFVKGFYRGVAQALWTANDVFMLQRIMELERQGMTREEAITKAGNSIPDYRIPSEIAGSRALSVVMQDPNFSMFGRYHYGIFKAYAHDVLSIVKGKTPKERMDAIGRLMALGFLVFVLYPFLDRAAQWLLGDDNAKAVRRGPATLPNALMEMGSGARNWLQVVLGFFSPGPIPLGIIEQAFNRDLYLSQFGDRSGKISDPATDWKQQLTDRLSHAAGGVLLFGQAQQAMAPGGVKSILLQQAGISQPTKSSLFYGLKDRADSVKAAIKSAGEAGDDDAVQRLADDNTALLAVAPAISRLANAASKLPPDEAKALFDEVLQSFIDQGGKL